MKNLDISTTLINAPTFKKKLWLSMKEEVLGEDYELSLVFVGDKKSQTLNQSFRGKTYPADVISFPIEKDMGEIFINFPKIKRDHKKWNRTANNFLDFLFIHGLAHLKGYDHIVQGDADKMERFEKKIRKKFEI